MAIEFKNNRLECKMTYEKGAGINMEEILNWTFIREVEVPDDIKDLLIDSEQLIASYKTMRDAAAFTNQRLIVQDKQGVTGTKRELYSIPYSSVIMWSTENSGIMDLSAEVTLWTRLGNIKINLKKGVDVAQFDRFLAEVCL